MRKAALITLAIQMKTGPAMVRELNEIYENIHIKRLAERAQKNQGLVRLQKASKVAIEPGGNPLTCRCPYSNFANPQGKRASTA
jgi:hypothetical protein